MTGQGVDLVLMPGQLAALQRRVELLVASRDQCLRQLAAASDEAAALSATPDGEKEAGRALKRVARLRTSLAATNGEIDTLRDMVAARISQGQRSR